MTMSARETFEVGTDTFNAHDLDGFADVIDENVVFTGPGGINGAGKAACVQFFAGWLTAFPDAHVDVHACHFVDDIAVEQGTFSGTHRGVLHGPGGGIPATGRSAKVDYTHVLRIREGKHVSFNLMFDRLQLLEQLGVAPASTD